MIGQTEPFTGIVIEYDAGRDLARAPVRISRPGPGSKPGGAGIGFIGAGSYAQSHLLPNIPASGRVRKIGVMTATGTGSRTVAERFGFEFCTGEERDILSNNDINTVFIATRHDSHAHYVVKALEAGKNVFVEKPLCLKEEELDQHRPGLQVFARDTYGGVQQECSLPLSEKLKELFGSGPMSMVCRVKRGEHPRRFVDPGPGDGRGAHHGEVCHFVDLLTFINGSLPVSVHADKLITSNGLGRRGEHQHGL